MEVKVLFLYFLFTSIKVATLPEVNGPVVIPLGVKPGEIQVSGDGEIIVMSFKNVSDVQIHLNNGYGFTFHQSLNGTINCWDIALSEDGKVIAMERNVGELAIYEKQDNN